MDHARLLRRIGTDGFVRRLVLLPSTGSTNDDVHRLAAEGAPEGTTVIAQEQTAGRGRLGRSWFSPAGVGIYVSVLFRPTRSSRELTRFTIGAAAAACEACRIVSGCEIRVEWPNDLVFSGRKIAGTLTETRSVGDRATELVVGTGFNANHSAEDFPEGLRTRATSLRIARGGSRVDVEALAAEYLTRLGRTAARLNAGEWETVSQAWSRLAVDASGCRVLVTTGNDGRDSFEGITRGLDSAGSLVVECADGMRTVIRQAESLIRLGS